MQFGVDIHREDKTKLGNSRHFTNSMTKELRETQTLRAGYSKAGRKIFALPQTPFQGVQDGQNLISWRWSLPLPINPVW